MILCFVDESNSVAFKRVIVISDIEEYKTEKTEDESITGEYFTRKSLFCQRPRHFLLKKFLVKFLLNVHIFGKIVVRMPKLENFGKIIGKK